MADRLNGPGAGGLAGLSDREILAAWEDAVAVFLDPGSAERRAIRENLVRGTRLSPEGLEAGLQAVLGGVRGEPAAELFAEAATLRRQGKGAPGVEASPSPLGHRVALRRGRRGRGSRGWEVSGSARFALVTLSSNLPALAVQPLLPALAARRPVLLKSSSAEPRFAPAFVRALARRLPALREAVAALSWPGGDEALEAPLLARAGVVLAYGDEGTVASLERRTRGAARFVAFGPRTSLAVLGAGAPLEQAAPGLARDVALFDQRGCLSVAAVYAEGDEARARELADALARELGRLAREQPPGPADPAAAGAVQQVRAEADVRGLYRPEIDPAARLAGGTVIVEPRPAFQPTPGLRTVRVHPLDHLARLPEVLRPWRGRLQGAAVAGSSAEALAPALEALGVSRIAAPGELQHPDALWHNGGVSPLEVLLGE